MLGSVVNDVSHLESQCPIMQLMVLPKSITHTKGGFSRLCSGPLMVAIGSPFTTDMMVPQDNLVDLLVCPSYSTMCDMNCINPSST